MVFAGRKKSDICIDFHSVHLMSPSKMYIRVSVLLYGSPDVFPYFDVCFTFKSVSCCRCVHAKKNQAAQHGRGEHSKVMSSEI